MIDNLIQEMPRSHTPLIPMRGRSTIPAAVPAGTGLPILPPTDLSNCSRNGIASGWLGATVPANILSPPVGHSPQQNVEFHSTPVFHHKIKEVDVVVVDQLPHVKFFRHWRLRFFKQISADSGRGEAALVWIGEIETARSIEDLVERDPNWVNFSNKLASGFMKILSGDFLRQIILLEEKLMTQQRTLNGRQLAFLIWDKFRRDADEVGLTEFFDLREVRLVNDDLKRFILDRDDVMFGLLNDQDPKSLLSLFDEQVKRCTHFRQVYAAYNFKCTHEGLEHSYQNLRKWVQAHIDQRQREKVKSQLQSNPTGNRAAAAGVGGGGPSGKPPGGGKG